MVGAGTAGLAAAHELSGRGFSPVLLEGTDQVGSSWRSRYDRLRLNTWRVMSGLPGRRYPRAAGRWPHRDDVVAYLERYAEGLDIRHGIHVHRIERAGHEWRLDTSDGEFQAPVVVVATGYDRDPVVPDWPGREGFTGELIHGSAYRSPAAFRDRDVLVVGIGNSGSEIAVDLAENGARSVRIAIRTGVNLMGPTFFGLPATVGAWLARDLPARIVDPVSLAIQRRAFPDLVRRGIVPAPWGIATELRVKGKGPVLDRGFSEAVQAGRVKPVAALQRFEGSRVALADGSSLEPDVVIAATGYRAGLEPLVGDLVELDSAGRPLCRERGLDSGAPGLYFVGFALPLTGQLPEVRRTARRVARSAARHAGRSARCRPAPKRPRAPRPVRA